MNAHDHLSYILCRFLLLGLFFFIGQALKTRYIWINIFIRASLFKISGSTTHVNMIYPNSLHAQAGETAAGGHAVQINWKSSVWTNILITDRGSCANLMYRPYLHFFCSFISHANKIWSLHHVTTTTKAKRRKTWHSIKKNFIIKLKACLRPHGGVISCPFRLSSKRKKKEEKNSFCTLALTDPT